MTPDAGDSQIQWEKPPTDGRAASPWAKVPDQLRAHPGEWAKFGGCSRGTAGHVRIRWLPPGEFEVVSRAVGNGRADVYARYIGGAATKRPRWWITDELLAETAEVYNSANTNQLKAVAAHLHRSEAQASRYIRLAKDKNLIPKKTKD